MGAKPNPSRIEIFSDHILIHLNGKHGGTAVCSPEDLNKVQNIAWRMAPTGYACRRIPRALGGGAYGMHVDILGGTNPGFVVDHLNGNRTDNRRENLRWATYSENRLNSSKKFHGCCKINESTWVANICVNGEKIYLGRFPSELDAIEARNAADLKYHGRILQKRSPQC